MTISRVVFNDPARKWFTWGLSALLAPTLAHRIPPHLDAMGVVHEPVEDAVGQRGIPNVQIKLLETA